MPIMKFGKYQGMDYSEVPTDYIQWLMDDTKKKLAEYERELDLRKNKAEDSWMNQIVEHGYNQLKCLPVESVNHTKLATAYKALKAAIADAAEPKGT